MYTIDRLSWNYKIHEEIAPTNPDTDTVSMMLYHNILVLKALGVQPLLTNNSTLAIHRPKVYYKFRLKSFSFLYSLIIFVTLFCSWTLFIFELLQWATFEFPIFVTGPHSNPTNSSSATTTMDPAFATQQILQVMFALGSIFHFGNLIWTCPLLVEYLNNWSELEAKMQRIFRHQNKRKVNFLGVDHFRKVQWVFTLILVSCMGAFIIPITKSQEKLSGSTQVISWYTISLSFWTIAIIIFIDMRCCMMLRLSEEAFSQIKLCICNDATSCQLNTEIIQSWQSVLKSARNQVVQSGSIQSLNLLMDLIVLFTLWCGAAFQGFVAVQTEGLANVWNEIAPSFGFCFTFYIRLARKIYLSEKLEIAEREIVKSLQLLDISRCQNDVATLLEVNILIDWLTTTPSKINIANMFTLSRRLLFGVVGQAVTYILVLLQFQYLQET